MEAMISVCAWCKKVKTPLGWTTESKALRILGINKRKMALECTHGICTSCATKWAPVDPHQFQESCQNEAIRVA